MKTWLDRHPNATCVIFFVLALICGRGALDSTNGAALRVLLCIAAIYWVVRAIDYWERT